MPDENRKEEILFYWLMKRLNKYTYAQLQAILEMFCALTEDEEGVRVDLGTISELRTEFIQTRRWAPTDDETIWTLRRFGFSYAEIGRVMNKTRSYVLRRFNAIRYDGSRQYFLSAMTEHLGQIAISKFMNAVREFSL